MSTADMFPDKPRVEPLRCQALLRRRALTRKRGGEARCPHPPQGVVAGLPDTEPRLACGIHERAGTGRPVVWVDELVPVDRLPAWWLHQYADLVEAWVQRTEVASIDALTWCHRTRDNLTEWRRRVARWTGAETQHRPAHLTLT